jgi:hypothetical protein
MTGWIVFWAALAVIFAAGEAFTRSWRLWPFAAAAALAIGAAAAGISVGLQWAIYALSAALLPFVASRLVPAARR